MFDILKFINVYVFIASFIFGTFAVYIVAPRTRTIVVTPSPDNVDKLQFKDKTDHYFEFRETKVKCPADKSIIEKQTARV